jgi:hypothetical protein
LSPADRGYLLGGWNEVRIVFVLFVLFFFVFIFFKIKLVHVEAAEHCESNQTSAPAPIDNVNSHFVAFACVDNHVVELDGKQTKCKLLEFN